MQKDYPLIYQVMNLGMRKAEVPNQDSVSGLAADTGNERGLLSIQTPVLEMSSYDLSTAM